jgi:hypothetical protein
MCSHKFQGDREIGKHGQGHCHLSDKLYSTGEEKRHPLLPEEIAIGTSRTGIFSTQNILSRTWESDRVLQGHRSNRLLICRERDYFKKLANRTVSDWSI